MKCHESLAEAYAEHRNKELAIKNYEHSVELNAQYENGNEALKKLMGNSGSIRINKSPRKVRKP
jgi:hypothetical protein